MKKTELRELAKKAWKRLRGGDLTPGRAAASVAIGLSIGVTPLWGVHWLIVVGVCLPLGLDAGLAFLASNISLPFVAPFITFAELEVGARLLHGAWLPLTPEQAKKIVPKEVLGEVALGTFVVALGASALGAAIVFGVGSAAARRRRRSLQG